MKFYPHSSGRALPPAYCSFSPRVLFVFLLLFLWLTGCQPKKLVEVTRIQTRNEEVIETIVVEVEGEAVEVEVVVTATPDLSVEFEVFEEPRLEQPEPEVAQEILGGVNNGGNGPVTSNDPTTVQTQDRLIIKDGQLSVTVADTDAAAQLAINLTIEFGGYVVEQRIWTARETYRYANLRVAVPVTEFENLMDAFRTLGMVMDESATGQDVTDQYVDLNSHLGNLYATQEQLRTFLEQTTTTEEALDVYEELVEVEEEINLIQGRINYLADRAAFSTINLALDPIIPTATPRPTRTPLPTRTPTPTPTATLIPTPDEWRPGDTAETAMVELQNSAQDSADFIIYNTILCGPGMLAAAVLAAFIWQVVRAVRRRREHLLPTVQDKGTAAAPSSGENG